MMYDAVCPIFLINEHFEKNVEAWFREVPIKTLYIGIGNTDKTIWNRIEDLPYKKIQIIDQTHYKTLGGCLVDLMKRTTTDWFVYFHGDARPTEKSFKQMEIFKNGKVGIIESEHLHVVKGKKSYHNYFDELRSYSGFQLIYRPSIESGIQQIEDDYIYRNEDLVFQNVCEFNGFEHKKCYAIHLHYVSEINDMMTFSALETHEIQWKGIVKYSPLINFLMTYLIVGAIRYNIKTFGLTMEEALQFIKENNNKWLNIIQEKLIENRGLS